MRAIKRWEGLRSFAGSLIAYTSDGVPDSDVVYGIIAKRPSAITWGGAAGFPMSRLVEDEPADADRVFRLTRDQMFHLTSQKLATENFLFRAVSFAELRTIISMVENDESRLEFRSKGSSLAFLRKFGREIEVNLAAGGA